MAALCAGLLSTASAAGISRDQFCAPQELVHYGPPSGLSPLHDAPPFGRLGFAPGKVRIQVTRQHSDDGMALTTEGIRFELRSIGAQGRLKLNWQVESRLTVIAGKGRPGKVAESRVQRVGGLGAGGTVIGIRPNTVRAGLYRLDLVFRAAT